ncbi:TRAP-type mannitol/chloroaromatic compound transport system, small permease component [Thalassovita gelatinovora]|uniref:TRAP transporter small permease protein n=1 Tax=Thalassovita gelatinovora TaxID=53501 RepID=A0A0P1FZK1_THAGE|nr:TRAP transporter small permease subunit [Thalassovita gelatinovora]QIZ80710.1 TRAP transporter small permease subunit [Thalassovita gelatinovora]CUH65305.1 TRAP-type mannitol/chloroaromatic compound transport system, small permease component [Thalassovita gelatinovora]SEQ89109.1 TRAP-type mannitol/chloroaromatic compound transport system, small permease component [Thalassovita gelatinovora]
MQLLISTIDRAVAGIGKTGALFLPLLMLTILLNVILRYVFRIGSIELEELQWHLNAIVVMSSLAWAYQCNRHVRVDAFHSHMSVRVKAVVEILGVTFLLFPFVWLVSDSAWTIFGYSWKLKEGSPMPSGLPARYIIKFVMAAGLSLLFLQGISVLLKAVKSLLHPSITTEKS